MNIRVEISSLATTNISGVGHYTRRLAEALDSQPDVELTAAYFNFLHRQPKPSISVKQPLEENSLVPLRVYAKLQSYGIAPPFDILLPPTDLTIFPNFATWPTIQTRRRATTVHDLTYMYFPEVVEEKNLAHLRRVVPRSLNEADFIITVSEAVKAELVKEFNLDPDRCTVTHPLPAPEYAQISNVDVHTKYNLPTANYILFIGNTEPRKNLITLIKAYRLLPQDIRNEYALVLAGSRGWKSDDIRQALADAQQDGEKIVHIGYVDQADSPALFQKASLFTMPSLYEGFGMQVCEAMAAGTPVVAGDIPSQREAGGDAALYADPKSPEDLRDKMLTILTTPTLVKKIEKAAVLQLQQFSWQKNADNVIEMAKKYLS